MQEPIQAISFGILLKRYRRAAGLTQEILAECAGYSTTYLSKLEAESGRRSLLLSPRWRKPLD